MHRRHFLQWSIIAGGMVGLAYGTRSLVQDPILIEINNNVETKVPKEVSNVDKGYLEKMSHFDADFREDIFLSTDEHPVAESVYKRIGRVQELVGHANFNVLGYEQMLKYAKNYTVIGDFSEKEIRFLESLFFEDANKYGFFGEKVLQQIESRVDERDTIKLAGTGHYLYRGDALRLYNKIRGQLGDSIILTSGIRGIVKQFYLFISKLRDSEWNLSKASRSLAPPGHSYHGIGDFDVGKNGLGYQNFTDDFAKTDEYKKLVDSGYVKIRYPKGNPYGVRFEPWHIKVIDDV